MRSLFFSGLAILGNPKKYNPYIKVNMNIDVNIFRILNILAYFKAEKKYIKNYHKVIQNSFLDVYKLDIVQELVLIL